MRRARSIRNLLFHRSFTDASPKIWESSHRLLLHNPFLVKHFGSAEATALQKQGPYATRLTSRAVIRLDGSETVKFLQEIVTNDVKHFDEEKQAQLPQPTLNHPSLLQPPIYTALLTPQGRFLFDMFVYKPAYADRSGLSPDTNGGEGSPVLFADVDAASVDDLIQHLKKYRLRSKVEIENVSKDLLVWQRFGGESMPSQVREGSGGIGWGSSTDATGGIAAEGDAKGWRWYTDPRLQELGLRGLFPSNVTPPLVEANEELSENFYMLWRLEQGVPEGPTEIRSGEAIPLEYNLAGLNAISFDKGCYMGQELVARTRHRGVIRKRIMPVEFVKDDGTKAEQAVAPGAKIHERASGKKVGTITTVLGFRGLALMRIEAASKEGHDLAVDSSEPVHIRVITPNWWPSEWGYQSAK